jgi:hypothetical protein
MSSIGLRPLYFESFSFQKPSPKREMGGQKYENQAGFSSVCGNPTGLAS